MGTTAIICRMKEFKYPKVKIELQKAKQMLADLLSLSGTSQQNIETLVDMLLEYDLHDNTFSGFGELDGLIECLKETRNKVYKMEVDKPALKLINGNGIHARLLGMEACALVSKMAKDNGIGIVGIYNSTYHGILETYSREIAKHDLIAIVSANGGPSGVAPHGGSKDIFGTNPLSYGIPTNGLPIVFDAATAKYAYGTIRLAKQRNEKLPEDSYFDKEGNLTTDPSRAVVIGAFGEHKGYAINLLLEVLTGTMVRAKSGLSVKNEHDLGSFFIAIDPNFFGPLEEFKNETSKLAQDILNVSPVNPKNPVRVPGYEGEKLKQEMLAEGFIYVDEKAWGKFEKFYEEKMNGNI